MAKEAISRIERHRDLLLQVDLDFAETLVGKRVLYLGIPIFKMLPYVPPPGTTDKYEGLRKWYRHNLENPSGLFMVHRIDFQHSLSKAQPDALDYLVTEDEAEREKHEGWKEPGNEAIEIEQWIFPASAVDMATVATDFIFENIRVAVIKKEREIDEIYYLVTPNGHTLYYSQHRKSKKSVSS